MAAPLIMIGLLIVGMVTHEPRKPVEVVQAPPKKEIVKAPDPNVITFVLDDPESHRYKIGEIDWKKVEANK